MGLDMYLYKRTYVKNWDFMKAEQKVKITIEGERSANIKTERITYIVEDVAYWRKFNALHGWFVDTCGKGIDECQEIPVSKNDLTNLLELLNEVKSVIDNAKKTLKIEVDWNNVGHSTQVYDCDDLVNKLLPPRKGFFFGSYGIDVSDTIEVLTRILDECDDDSDFYYRASW
jgi:hypothetical protein